MEKRTICCKLATTKPIYDALKETSEVFSDACNHILKIVIKEKTHNAIELHKLCYKDVRSIFGLSSNLSIRAIRRVVSCMTRLKGKRKAPKFFKPKSIDYDARIFTYREREETVSITTTRGRIHIPLDLGDRQREALNGKNPTAATVINKSGTWYIHIIVEFEPEACTGSGNMGIDLGINNIVATSNGTLIEGKSRQEFKKERHKVRASLQSKGTRGAKKVLKRLSGKEKRRTRHENHVISKKIVEEAKRHECGLIRMEQLKGIRERTKMWNKHLNRTIAGWSFYQLQQFVNYKASSLGISTALIDPAYTSQTCHSCLTLGSRKGDRFNCITCGEQHADVNASRVIAIGGVACKPAQISALG